MPFLCITQFWAKSQNSMRVGWIQPTSIPRVWFSRINQLFSIFIVIIFISITIIRHDHSVCKRISWQLIAFNLITHFAQLPDKTWYNDGLLTKQMSLHNRQWVYNNRHSYSATLHTLCIWTSFRMFTHWTLNSSPFHFVSVLFRLLCVNLHKNYS